MGRRIAAAQDLIEGHGRTAFLALISSTTLDLDANVRNGATGAPGSPELVPTFIALLHDETLEVRAPAAFALAAIGTPALDKLQQVYLAGDSISCMFAAIALCQIKYPRVASIFFEEGEASDLPGVRKWAEQLGGATFTGTVRRSAKAGEQGKDVADCELIHRPTCLLCGYDGGHASKPANLQIRTLTFLHQLQRLAINTSPLPPPACDLVLRFCPITLALRRLRGYSRTLSMRMRFMTRTIFQSLTCP